MLIGTGCSGSDDASTCDGPTDEPSKLARSIDEAAGVANRAQDRRPPKPKSPLAAIPTSLVPSGTSQYTAYVGLSWFLSKEWGNGSSTRTPQQIEIRTDIGWVRLQPSGNEVVATMSDGKVLRGTIRCITDGVEFRAKSGEVVEITRDDDVISVDFEGFDSTAANNLGLYLKRK